MYVLMLYIVKEIDVVINSGYLTRETIERVMVKTIFSPFVFFVVIVVYLYIYYIKIIGIYLGALTYGIINDVE